MSWNWINIAYHKEYEKPIAASHDWDNLIELIREYFDTSFSEITWHPYNSKYPDEYQGYFEHTDVEGIIHTVKVYETDFK